MITGKRRLIGWSDQHWEACCSCAIFRRRFGSSRSRNDEIQRDWVMLWWFGAGAGMAERAYPRRGDPRARHCYDHKRLHTQLMTTSAGDSRRQFYGGGVVFPCSFALSLVYHRVNQDYGLNR